MPTLDEGTLFYMPVTLPGLSITKAAELLQTQNKIIKSFPEVASVFGKAGRAATATDPAPLEMFETVINLKPKSEWRPGMTVDKLIAEMDRALQFPGRQQRLDHADQGAHRHAVDRHPHAGRHQAVRPRPDELEQVARQVEAAVRAVPGTTSAFAERVTGGYYLDIVPDRAALARYGLTIEDVQQAVATRARRRGGDDHGRGPRALYGERPLSARLPLRSAGDRLRRAGPDHARAACVPLGQVAEVAPDAGRRPASAPRTPSSPSTSSSISATATSAATSPTRARPSPEKVDFPPGYLRDLERPVRISRAGGSAAEDRRAGDAAAHLPAALSQLPAASTETLIVMLSLPFALVGGLWLVWWMGFNMSVAVAVGFIALAGVAAETGVVMLIYLDHALAERQRACAAEGRAFDARRSARRDHGGRGRAGAAEDDDGGRDHGRPAADPVDDGTGSEVMQRIAVPMIGGMVSLDAPDAARHPGDLWAGEGLGYRVPNYEYVRPSQIRVGVLNRGLVAALTLLDGWTLHTAVGAIDAAVARLGLQDRPAALAVVEVLAGVRGHRIRSPVPAIRASDGRLQNGVRHQYIIVGYYRPGLRRRRWNGSIVRRTSSRIRRSSWRVTTSVGW